VPEPLLEVERVRKTYVTPHRSVEVLRDCSLRLPAGESMSILGASGSGKSTLLHILGTLERPDAGHVLFEGRDLVGARPAQLTAFRGHALGFIFQFHHLLPEFSALENVAIPALIARRGRGEAFERATELLERVGLSDRLEHRPAELSGGEQQRVAVARALIGKPRLILADEPTGNLDRRTGAQVADHLFQLIDEEGTSLVLVTHDREQAARAGQCLELTEGELRVL